MAGKSIEQRVAEADERIRQLQARKETLEQQLHQKERKERTRRLIQIGGIMVRLGVDTPEKAQALQKEIQQRPEVQKWVLHVLARVSADSEGLQ